MGTPKNVTNQLKDKLMKPTLDLLLKLGFIHDESTERQKKNGTTQYRSKRVVFAIQKNGLIRDLTGPQTMYKSNPEGIFYKVMVERLFPSFQIDKRGPWIQYAEHGKDWWKPGEIESEGELEQYVAMNGYNTFVSKELKNQIDQLTLKDIKERVRHLNKIHKLFKDYEKIQKNKEYTEWIDQSHAIHHHVPIYEIPLTVFKPYIKDWMKVVDMDEWRKTIKR